MLLNESITLYINSTENGFEPDKNLKEESIREANVIVWASAFDLTDILSLYFQNTRFDQHAL